jgi:predicted double-glycine peptidase
MGCALALIAGGGSSARASSLDTVVAGRVELGVQSWRALRDAGVVRQAFDYSCGAAALATLISASGDPTTEREVLLEVFEGLPDEEVARTMEQGLSLLDLKRVAQRRGHVADGYRIPADILARLTRPVLVLIEPHGYAHFAVLRGVRDGSAYLADPARGNVRMAADRFLEIWLGPGGEGVVFVVDAGPSSRLDLALVTGARPEVLAARQLLAIGPGHPSVRHRRRLP